MIDFVNGKARIRAWPRKRGTPNDLPSLFRTEVFAAAQRAWRYIAPDFALFLTQMTARSPLLPRDILTMILYNLGYWDMAFRQPRRFPVYFKEQVSLSLDAISQTPDTVAVRRAQGWEPAPYNPGGGTWEPIFSGDPATAPATRFSVELDVSAYAEIQIQCRPVTTSGGAILRLDVSTDGGATWLASTNQLLNMFSNGNVGANTGVPFWTSSQTAGNGIVTVNANIPGSYCPMTSINVPGETKILATAAGPINRIRIFTQLATQQVTGGLMIVMGRR